MGLSFDEYVKGAVRSESEDFPAIRERLEGLPSRAYLILTMRVIAVLCDQLDRLKKHIFYGKEFNPEEYHSALNTCGKELVYFLRNMKYQTPEQVPEVVNKSDKDIRVLHSVIGIGTELAEMIGPLLLYIQGEGDLDEVNLAEEFGDNQWYSAVGTDALGRSLEDVCRQNLEKLKARFPEKFEGFQALNRDLNAERQTLEIHQENTLTLMVGIPRSGKSTHARKLGYPIVCPDDIRVSLHGEKFIGKMEPYVWAIARTMAESLFRSGHKNVILDATNVSRERRDAWKSKFWQRKAIVVTTPFSVCAMRAEESGFPIEVLERMKDNCEEIEDGGDSTEGFVEVSYSLMQGESN